nr:zf-TFIIB domain-containing protein [Parapedobacter pyrenivorans]
MNCPNCNVTLLMTVRSNVEIDYCPQCRGIWLDKGELDKLLEQDDKRGQSSPQRQEYRGHDDDYRDRDYRGDPRYHKKKKSFLGDIFDF